MTTTALPTTGRDVIEALDFQPEIPCEWEGRHPEGGPKATDYWLSHCSPIAVCRNCDATIRHIVARYDSQARRCQNCGARGLTAHAMRYLGPVRS